MEINIKECNNITSAEVTIEIGKLNIKFAPNGTGKSTISKAIQFNIVKKEQDLAELLPFKYRSENPDNIRPEVVGTDQFRSVLCFNEEYVNKFTFQPDELVNNSFDIFIRTDSYRSVEEDIKELVRVTQQQFTNNPDLDALLLNLTKLSDAFKVTARGGLSKSSSGAKGLSEGNKIEHIPFGLESYQPFIRSEKSVSWIDWQSKGHKEFSDISDSCPFCTMDATGKEEQISKVGQEYDKSLIKNLINIISVVEDLGEFLSDDTRENLNVITSLKDGIEKEHEELIVTIKVNIDTMVDKLNKIKTLSGFHFKEGEKVSEKLPAYKIDLQFFHTLNSVRTSEFIDPINESINNLIQHAGHLQGKINIQRREIKGLVEKHQKDINDFLSYAGYRYEVAIVGEGEQAQLKLRHVDNNGDLNGGGQHLSFGERNAFSIVLFMYECLAKKPELIILDDPISSFDKNKKYAILEMLFRRDAQYCLKSKTVLMLTHDVEPIIDTLKSVRGQFNNQVNATYLRLRNGVIDEQRITGSDISTFFQICDKVLKSDQSDIVKMIYLRRSLEVVEDGGRAYQVLSNIFKKREMPEDHRIPKDQNGNSVQLTSEDLAGGIGDITRYIPSLPADYSSLVALFSDDKEIRRLYVESNNGYEKLQLTRILLDIETIDNSVIRKFINETYHIENEFIYQLDPTQFDLIPEYVVKECDRILEEVIE